MNGILNNIFAVIYWIFLGGFIIWAAGNQDINFFIGFGVGIVTVLVLLLVHKLEQRKEQKEYKRQQEESKRLMEGLKKHYPEVWKELKKYDE